jgi:hypothetical protein
MPRRVLEDVGKPPARNGQVALAGQRPPDETPAKSREKRTGDAATSQAFDRERTPADTHEPSRHREFARAIPPAPIPDTGPLGAMSHKVEFLRWIERLVLSHDIRACKIPRRHARGTRLTRFPTAHVTGDDSSWASGNRHSAVRPDLTVGSGQFSRDRKHHSPSPPVHLPWYTGCSIFYVPEIYARRRRGPWRHSRGEQTMKC